jgi:hypothetical protein
MATTHSSFLFFLLSMWHVEAFGFISWNEDGCVPNPTTQKCLFIFSPMPKLLLTLTVSQNKERNMHRF